MSLTTQLGLRTEILHEAMQNHLIDLNEALERIELGDYTAIEQAIEHRLRVYAFGNAETELISYLEKWKDVYQEQEARKVNENVLNELKSDLHAYALDKAGIDWTEMAFDATENSAIESLVANLTQEEKEQIDALSICKIEKTISNSDYWKNYIQQGLVHDLLEHSQVKKRPKLLENVTFHYQEMRKLQEQRTIEGTAEMFSKLIYFDAIRKALWKVK